MGKLELVKKGAKELFDKNLPDLLVGTGIILNGWGLVSGIKVTPKAVDILNAEKEMKGEDLTIKEVIEATWKLYLPTAIEVVLGDACIIGGTVCFHKRNASLLALCSLSETTLGLYKDKLVEAVGKEKAEEIENDISVERKKLESQIDNRKLRYVETANGLYALPANGEEVWWDAYTDKKFIARDVDLEHAANKCNEAIISNGWVPLNDFYYELGLGGVRLGEDKGWDSLRRKVEIRFTNPIYKDGIMCRTFEFVYEPYSI